MDFTWEATPFQTIPISSNMLNCSSDKVSFSHRSRMHSAKLYSLLNQSMKSYYLFELSGISQLPFLLLNSFNSLYIVTRSSSPSSSSICSFYKGSNRYLLESIGVSTTGCDELVSSSFASFSTIVSISMPNNLIFFLGCPGKLSITTWKFYNVLCTSFAQIVVSPFAFSFGFAE